MYRFSPEKLPQIQIGEDGKTHYLRGLFGIKMEINPKHPPSIQSKQFKDDRGHPLETENPLIMMMFDDKLRMIFRIFENYESNQGNNPPWSRLVTPLNINTDIAHADIVKEANNEQKIFTSQNSQPSTGDGQDLKLMEKPKQPAFTKEPEPKLATP